MYMHVLLTVSIVYVSIRKTKLLEGFPLVLTKGRYRDQVFKPLGVMTACVKLEVTGNSQYGESEELIRESTILNNTVTVRKTLNGAKFVSFCLVSAVIEVIGCRE